MQWRVSLDPSLSRTSYLILTSNWQTCGGQGSFLSLYYDTTRYSPSTGTFIGGSGSSSSSSSISTSQTLQSQSTLSNRPSTSQSLSQSQTLQSQTTSSSQSSSSPSLSQSQTLQPQTTSSSQSSSSQSVSQSQSLAQTRTSTSVSAISTSKVGHKQTVGNFQFIGCYTEGAGGVRALTAATFNNYINMNMTWCSIACNGYNYFGVENGTDCYCG
jgi:iron transport multicopper oxidase